MDEYLRISWKNKDLDRRKTEKGEETVTDRSRMNVCNSLAFHSSVYPESFSKLMTVKMYILGIYDGTLNDVKCRVRSGNRVHYRHVLNKILKYVLNDT